MITSSNSSLRRSGIPSQLLGVLLHTTAIFGLSRSARSRSNQRACPLASIPTHLHSLSSEITLELLRFLAVLQSTLPAFASIGIHKSNLLKTRVVVTT